MNTPATYPQFPTIADCDERIRKLETAKDSSYLALRKRFEVAGREISRLHVEIETRKDVHRGDYARAAVLVAGLREIQRLGGEASGVANRVLDEALKPYGYSDEP